MDGDLLLIRKMKNGDGEAVESFVRKYYPDILRYCRRHLAGNPDAEDLTQETFERFFRNFQAYRHYGKALNFLYVIAGNLCKDYYSRRAELSLDHFPESGEETPGEIEGRVDLETALMGLPPDLREVLILHYYQDLKQREIAAILEISLPLVKYRMRQAKELLKEKIGEEESDGEPGRKILPQ